MLAVARGNVLVRDTLGCYDQPLREVTAYPRHCRDKAITCCSFRSVQSASSTSGSSPSSSYLPGHVLVAAGGQDGVAWLWDMNSDYAIDHFDISHDLDVFMEFTHEICHSLDFVQFNPTGDKLLIAFRIKLISHQGISVVDLSTSHTIFSLMVGMGPRISFRDDYILHFMARTGELLEFDSSTGRRRRYKRLNRPADTNNCWISCSCDLIALSAGAVPAVTVRDFDQTITVKDRQRTFLGIGHDSVRTVIFSPDNERIAVLCTQCIAIIEMSSENEVVIPNAVDWSRWEVSEAAFDPTGTHLAIALHMTKPSAWWYISSLIRQAHQDMLVLYEVRNGIKIAEIHSVGQCVAFHYPSEVILM
jgi:WD40 repeat protein